MAARANLIASALSVSGDVESRRGGKNAAMLQGSSRVDNSDRSHMPFQASAKLQLNQIQLVDKIPGRATERTELLGSQATRRNIERGLIRLAAPRGAFP
jgi:hypothetical protein